MAQQKLDIVRLYKHWKRGLLCCLSPALRRRLDPETTPYIIEAESDGGLAVYQEFDGERADLGRIPPGQANPGVEPLQSLKGRNKTLTLRLPAGQALRKRVRFPAATAENIRQVVGFEMDRLTPFSMEQVYYDCQLAEYLVESAEIAVDLVVVPRSRLAGIQQRLGELGLRVAAIDTLNAWEEMNLLPRAERPGRSRLALAGTLAMWGLTALFLAAVLITPLWQKRSIAIELEQRIARSKEQAMVVTKLRGKVDQGLELLNRVPERRNALRPAVDVLRDLTQLLPDDTWVQQLELKNGEVELRGLSRQATSLIEQLEGNPSFDKVGFRSPVLQAGGEERFHLTAGVTALSATGSAAAPAAGNPAADARPDARGRTGTRVVAGNGQAAAAAGDLMASGS